MVRVMCATRRVRTCITTLIRVIHWNHLQIVTRKVHVSQLFRTLGVRSNALVIRVGPRLAVKASGARTYVADTFAPFRRERIHSGDGTSEKGDQDRGFAARKKHCRRMETIQK
jgi:hypothetical protein